MSSGCMLMLVGLFERTFVSQACSDMCRSCCLAPKHVTLGTTQLSLPMSQCHSGTSRTMQADHGPNLPHPPNVSNPVLIETLSRAGGWANSGWLWGV